MAEEKRLPELAALIAEFEASGMAELHVTSGGYELLLRRETKPEEPTK